MARLHTLPPTEQVYTSHVPARYIGFPIEKYFASRFSYQSEEKWMAEIRAGKIAVNGVRAALGVVLCEHDEIVTQAGVRVEPPANRQLEVVFENRHLRIFNKSAPIPVHPSGRYFQNSMTELLKEVYPDEVPRPIQRLDLGTTGVIVFARTKLAAAFLMHQFKNKNIYKEYLAIVEGTPSQKKFSIDTPIGKVDGSKRGVGSELVGAKPAMTEVQLLTSRNGRSLLKIIPRSGRTNQIRVHLASLGLPIVNDRIYGREENSNHPIGLHAHRIRFNCFDDFLDVTARPPAHFHAFQTQGN
jgi:RluA family pseudouridine synthase